MAVDLKGRTALVTGSTSGIGEASAIAPAARGAHVLVVGRDAERAEQVVAAIDGNGGRASFTLTSPGDLGSVGELVEWATGPATVTSTSSSTTLESPSAVRAVRRPKKSSTRRSTSTSRFRSSSSRPWHPPMAERGSGSIVNVSTQVAGFGAV